MAHIIDSNWKRSPALPILRNPVLDRVYLVSMGQVKGDADLVWSTRRLVAITFLEDIQSYLFKNGLTVLTRYLVESH